MVLLMFAAGASASGDFALDDQFERTHHRANIFKDGPVVVIAGAQRNTPDAMHAWEQALRTRIPADARIFGLSNLKKLPFFVPKSSVRKTLAQQFPRTPVLCDWKGRVYPALGFPPDALISVGVFGASGKPLGIVTGERTEERITQVLTALER